MDQPSGIVSQAAGYIIVIVVVIIAIAALDYWQTKQYKKINNKIFSDPAYLADPEKRNLCNTLLQQSRPLGLFALMEMRKLKKSLDSYKV